MARPVSEAKRSAILESATNAIAEAGVAAPTLTIARGAGIAEGTLFTYFPSKDALLNELYLQIKREIAEEMLRGYQSDTSDRESWRHVWGAYVDWAIRHPARRKAMAHLAVSDRILEQTRSAAAGSFKEIQQVFDRSLSSGVLRRQPADFIVGLMQAIAELTIDHTTRQPSRHEELKDLGFQAFWNSVASA